MMKQSEIARYLKCLTIGVSILFTIFVVWFLPSVIRDTLDVSGNVYRGICIFLWGTAIPCFFSLISFWGICVRIGADRSFSVENAQALKRMSYYMLMDTICYSVLLVLICLLGWYELASWLLFVVITVLCICIALTVVCAALSHLVYKASQLQEEQDLTI